MKTRVIINPEQNELSAQLVALYHALRDVAPGEGITFDLTKLSWACPLLLLPLAAYINDIPSGFKPPGSANARAYLDAVHFPGGVDSVSEFKRAERRHDNFIPVSVLRQESGIEREQLEEAFLLLITRQLEATAAGVRNAIYYPITEWVGNIFEHSRVSAGYLFGQAYPQAGYIDICIVDRGRGLAASYREERGIDITEGSAHSASSQTG